MKIYIDGKYYDKDQAKISVFDHGLLYGDGVFEGLRIYDGKIFKLKEHLIRLYQSAKAILLDVSLNKKEMEKAVLDAVKMNEKNNGYIRLLVTRGEGSLGIDPGKCPHSSVIIIVGDIDVYPQECYEKGIRIITSSIRRSSVESLDPRIKSLNYLNNIMAKIEAKQAGCLEAVMLNKDGMVAECTGDNIFIIKNRIAYTPLVQNGILEGITRNTVFELLNDTNIKFCETSLSSYDLYNADECFLTGSAVEIIPVIMIDGRVIGDGTLGFYTKKLIKNFKLKTAG